MAALRLKCQKSSAHFILRTRAAHGPIAAARLLGLFLRESVMNRIGVNASLVWEQEYRAERTFVQGVPTSQRSEVIFTTPENTGRFVQSASESDNRGEAAPNLAP